MEGEAQRRLWRRIRMSSHVARCSWVCGSIPTRDPYTWYVYLQAAYKAYLVLVEDFKDGLGIHRGGEVAQQHGEQWLERTTTRSGALYRAAAYTPVEYCSGIVTLECCDATEIVLAIFW